MDTERRSPNLSLSAFRIPRYKYLPKNSREQWERLRILQACERLEIPKKLWPQIAFPPPQFSVRMWIPNRPEKFNLPPFEPLVQSIAEWRKIAHAAFDKTLDEYSPKFLAQFNDALKQGQYTKIPQSRDAGSFDVRYEWAAQRICYRTPYKELGGSRYTAERVKQAVLQILKNANLKQGK